ncbi:hypothetical protein V8E53_015487 [Lactarius tabidus]
MCALPLHTGAPHNSTVFGAGVDLTCIVVHNRVNPGANEMTMHSCKPCAFWGPCRGGTVPYLWTAAGASPRSLNRNRTQLSPLFELLSSDVNFPLPQDENGQKAASDLSHLFAFAFVLTCACASSACVLALLHSSNSKALRVPRLSTEEKKQQENCQQLFVDVVCEKSPEPSKLLAVQFPTGLRRCMACQSTRLLLYWEIPGPKKQKWLAVSVASVGASIIRHGCGWDSDMVIKRLNGLLRAPAAGHRAGAKMVAWADVINSNSVRDRRGIFTYPHYNLLAPNAGSTFEGHKPIFFISQLLFTYAVLVRLAHGRQKLKKNAEEKTVTSEVGYRVRSLLLSWHRNVRGERCNSRGDHKSCRRKGRHVEGLDWAAWHD